jgi:hypothetical protein
LKKVSSQIIQELSEQFQDEAEFTKSLDENTITLGNRTFLKNNEIIKETDPGFHRIKVLQSLELNESSTEAEINQKVRKLSLVYHPDKAQESQKEESLEKFNALQDKKSFLLNLDDPDEEYEYYYKTSNPKLVQGYVLVYLKLPKLMEYLSEGYRFMVRPCDTLIPIDWENVQDDLWCYTDPLTEGYFSFYETFGSGLFLRYSDITLGVEFWFDHLEQPLKDILCHIVNLSQVYEFDVCDIYYKTKVPEIYIIPSSVTNTYLKELFLGYTGEISDQFKSDLQLLQSYTFKKNSFLNSKTGINGLLQRLRRF